MSPEEFPETTNGSETVEYTYNGEMPVGVTIIQALCDIADVEPVDTKATLGFTLYDHIDPEALDRFIGDGSGSGDIVVDLTLHNDNTYLVQVRDDGTVLAQSQS